MTQPMRLEGRTAVITGAAGGIGRAIAVSLVRRGCHLALADVDENGLVETADLVRTNALRVSTHRIDVADRNDVAAFPDVVSAAHDSVDLLVNNAGVALGGRFDQVSDKDFEWLFEIVLSLAYKFIVGFTRFLEVFFDFIHFCGKVRPLLFETA